MAVKNKSAQKKAPKAKAGAAGAISGAYTHLGMQLAILDRGFVYVGDVKTDSEWGIISNAKNVRRWGTKEGLGELALKGPLPDTQLDDTGTVRAPMRSVIALIACNQRKWKA